MEFLANSTNLGTLEVLEIYIQFNGARLLACKNQAGKIFLALWVDEEEEYDLWLYMLVSLDRLQAIRTGEISLRQAFIKSENDFLYELNYSHMTSSWAFEKIALENLDEDYLPLEGSFLKCDPETLPQVISQKVIRNAISKTREIVNLVLQPLSDKYPNEFPASGLGNILAAFQSLMNELNVSKGKSSGLEAKEIVQKSSFNVFAVSQGSFQVELASSFFDADLLGNSIAGDATDKLLNLIRIGSNVNDLQNSILTGNKKIAGKYSTFLKSLITSGTGIRLEWGSPTISRGGCVEANLLLLHETLEVVNRIESLEIRQIEIIGDLFKVDKIGWKFGISDLGTNYSYKGDILEEAKPDARIATISRTYKALIREVPEIIPTTNETKKKHQLLALKVYESANEQLKLQ
ncbi:MAG: hypothetical protein LH649_06745 [Pseudanabaena sp. CAN_BIN31]|nr:hypothetical protein [Pseudanabaena sp. CAN_BIN31]